MTIDLYEFLKCFAQFFWETWQGLCAVGVLLCGVWSHRATTLAKIPSMRPIGAAQHQMAYGLAIALSCLPLYLLSNDLGHYEIPDASPQVSMLDNYTMHSLWFLITIAVAYVGFYFAGRGAHNLYEQTN